MKEIFLRLLTLSLTCSVVLATLLIFSRKLRGRYAAKTLYFLWLFLALRMVLPLSFLLPQAPVTIALPSYDVTILAMPPSAPKAPAFPGGQSANAVDTPSEDVTVTVTQSVALGTLAGAVWLAGIGVFLVWQIAGYLLARRRFFQGVRWEAEHIEGVAVYRSLCVCTPVAMGLLRPVIFLPAQGVDRESEAVALAHERCHIERHDLWYKALFLLVNAVHWFNPLAWLMAREAGRNVECCCDDQVLCGADGATRKHYGQVLLNTAAGSSYPAFSTHFGSGKKQLKERLSNLFQPKKNSALLVCITLAVALLVGGLVACESVALEKTAPVAGEIYATYDFAGQAEGTDYEIVKLAVVDYNPDTDTLGEGSEEQAFIMAEDMLVRKEEGGNAISPGKKGTEERGRELMNFFLWPQLRATSYPGESDLIELVLNEAGEVAQMTWRRTKVVEDVEPSKRPPVLSVISNLPWELYESCPVHEDKNVGRSAGIYSHSMQVTEPMDFTITVDRVSGVLEFGVKEGNKLFGGSYVYEQREFGSESDTFRLEPGHYEIVMHMEAFQGSYHLVGAKTLNLWPVEGEYQINSHFWLGEHYFTGEPGDHTGCDISAPAGTQVRVVAGGTVTEVSDNSVFVTHNDHWQTRYAGLKDVAVTVGATVERGTILGAVWDTVEKPAGLEPFYGTTSLHYEYLVDGQWVNPLDNEYFNYAKADGTALSKGELSAPQW